METSAEELEICTANWQLKQPITSRNGRKLCLGSLQYMLMLLTIDIPVNWRKEQLHKKFKRTCLKELGKLFYSSTKQLTEQVLTELLLNHKTIFRKSIGLRIS